MMKILGNIFTVACIAIMVWIGASWVDVVVDNSTTAQHASWNAFSILVEMAEKK